MSLISKMDTNTYEAVKSVICPYCAVKLPTTLRVGHQWMHSIPNTEFRFDCLANPLRIARYDPTDEPKENS